LFDPNFECFDEHDQSGHQGDVRWKNGPARNALAQGNFPVEAVFEPRLARLHVYVQQSETRH